MRSERAFFASAPKGMEGLLQGEIRDLTGQDPLLGRGGVSFQSDIVVAYRICLWSRIASRVFMELGKFPAPDSDELYRKIKSMPWEEHLSPEGTLAVNFTSTKSRLGHTQFGARRVKDAIVDRFREKQGVRPSVSLTEPDIRIRVHLFEDQAVVSLDLAGESLHKRGYREDGLSAPMKENLAAAVLMRAGWPNVAAAGGAFVDPMCGSGTLPIEAAMMAASIAPGLMRSRFGFSNWLQHDRTAWKDLLDEAMTIREKGTGNLPPIIGYDADENAARMAISNVRRAGLDKVIRIEQRDITEAIPPRGAIGLVAANPPYGERLGTERELRLTYENLGRCLRNRFAGWKAAVFTGNPDLAMRLGIRAGRRYSLYNGPIKCSLFLLDVNPSRFMARPARPEGPGEGGERVMEANEGPAGPGAIMLANRLGKNLRNIGKWAEREKVTCYRLYDADMPEYAVAVDIYEEKDSKRQWACVQEYEAPPSVDRAVARMRLEEAMTTISRMTRIPEERVVLRVRRRQRGPSQYGRIDAAKRFIRVGENECVFLVNLTDYLDTGLFLDHRNTRRIIRKMSAGRRFLNLFAYTGTATVCAARGGAAATTSVDMSASYLKWARKNMEINGFGGRNAEFVQADCLAWIKEHKRRYGLIFLDPPTFSNSKKMAGHLDISRDHPFLIRAAAGLLEKGGVLIFSNNYRKFKMNRDALKDLQVEDITMETIPRDFSRRPRIHNCWRITRK